MPDLPDITFLKLQEVLKKSSILVKAASKFNTTKGRLNRYIHSAKKLAHNKHASSLGLSYILTYIVAYACA